MIIRRERSSVYSAPDPPSLAGEHDGDADLRLVEPFLAYHER
jgi:hypothetical protein